MGNKLQINEESDVPEQKNDQSEPKSALDKQIGGSHYKDMKIQPIDFIIENNLGYAVGNIIKYIVRYKNKNGVEDLKKARHYLDILIEKNNG
jgi:hypothetical protein